MDHVIASSTAAFAGTTHALDFTIFHDGLSAWWEADAQATLPPGASPTARSATSPPTRAPATRTRSWATHPRCAAPSTSTASLTSRLLSLMRLFHFLLSRRCPSPLQPRHTPGALPLHPAHLGRRSDHEVHYRGCDGPPARPGCRYCGARLCRADEEFRDLRHGRSGEGVGSKGRKKRPTSSLRPSLLVFLRSLILQRPRK